MTITKYPLGTLFDATGNPVTRSTGMDRRDFLAKAGVGIGCVLLPDFLLDTRAYAFELGRGLQRLVKWCVDKTVTFAKTVVEFAVAAATNVAKEVISAMETRAVSAVRRGTSSFHDALSNPVGFVTGNLLPPTLTGQKFWFGVDHLPSTGATRDFGGTADLNHAELQLLLTERRSDRTRNVLLHPDSSRAEIVESDLLASKNIIKNYYGYNPNDFSVLYKRLLRDAVNDRVIGAFMVIPKDEGASPRFLLDLDPAA